MSFSGEDCEGPWQSNSNQYCAVNLKFQYYRLVKHSHSLYDKLDAIVQHITSIATQCTISRQLSSVCSLKVGPEALFHALVSLEQLHHAVRKSSAILCIEENVGERKCSLATGCEAPSPSHGLHDRMLNRWRAD